MNQVGLEQHWLYFLREYIRPIQEKIFTGYFHDVNDMDYAKIIFDHLFL